MSDIGRRYRFAREQAGLSIAQTARLSGLDAEDVRAIEEGIIIYDPAGRLPSIYGIDPAWLIQGADFEGFVLKNFTPLVDALIAAGRKDLALELMGMSGTQRQER